MPRPELKAAAAIAKRPEKRQKFVIFQQRIQHLKTFAHRVEQYVALITLITYFYF